MSLLPRTNNSAGSEIYFALKSEIPVAQTLSQNGNTISLSGGGGSVNVASATAVALSTQKLTATTYDLGFNATNFSGLVKSEGEIISAPNLGQGSATLNGGLAEVTVGAVPPASLPKVRFQKSGFPDATMEYTGAAFTFNPPLTDSDFQTLSLIGNDLTISGGNTVDLSGMPVITALQDKAQNISAVPGTTDISGELAVRGGDVNIYNGANPSVNFYDSLGAQKATLDYTDINDKVTLSGTNFVFDAANKARLVMDTTFGQGSLTRTDGLPISMTRFDATGTTVDTGMILNSTDVTVSLPNGYTVAMDGVNSKMTSTLPIFQATSGLVEGVEIGLDSGNNIVRGFGLPLTIAQDASKQPTDFMIFDKIGDGTGGINITSSEYFDVNATKEARIQSGESIKMTSALDPATAPSVAIKNLAGNCVLDMEAQGGKGGRITADEGSGSFVFEGRSGFSSSITAYPLVSISTQDPASAIGMTAGGAGANVDIVANGDDTGRIIMVAQTSGIASELTIDGSTTTGIITAKSDELVLNIGGSVGTAGQALISNGTSAVWGDIPVVWGSFCNTGTVNIATPNLITAIPHTTNTTISYNCQLSGGSIVILKDCSKLRIQSSLIASPSANNTTFRFWLYKSPANVPNSQSIVSLKSVADKALCVCEWYVSAVYGDVFTILCESDFASTIYAEVGTVSRPACPSIITSVTGYV